MNYKQFNRLRRLENAFDEALDSDDYGNMEHFVRLGQLYSRRQDSALPKLDRNARQIVEEKKQARLQKNRNYDTIVQIAQVEGIPAQVGVCYNAKLNPEYYGRIALAKQVLESGCQNESQETNCLNCIAFAIPLCQALDDIMEDNDE